MIGSVRSIRGLFCHPKVDEEEEAGKARVEEGNAAAGVRGQGGAVESPKDERKILKAHSKWGLVKKKMVDPARITNCLNSLKRSSSESTLGSLGQEFESRLKRSGSESELSEGGEPVTSPSPAASGIAGMFVKTISSTVQSGPRGPRHMYAKTQSKCIKRTLNPHYDQTFELHLEGGEIDKNGDYRNPHAPFTKFRMTMWDHDALSRDDFMGEVTVPLGALMSSRTLEGWYDLEDPEGAYDNDDDKPLTGRVYLKFKWNSEALMQGSVRPKSTTKEEETRRSETPSSQITNYMRLSQANSLSPPVLKLEQAPTKRAHRSPLAARQGMLTRWGSQGNDEEDNQDIDQVDSDGEKQAYLHVCGERREHEHACEDQVDDVPLIATQRNLSDLPVTACSNGVHNGVHNDVHTNGFVHSMPSGKSEINANSQTNGGPQEGDETLKFQFQNPPRKPTRALRSGECSSVGVSFDIL
jgi:hypothetical protein